MTGFASSRRSAPRSPPPVVNRRLCSDKPLSSMHSRTMPHRIVLKTFRGAAQAWWADDCVRMGASLSYYTLFAIAPVLLVATAIAGLAFGPAAVRLEIVAD